MQLVSIDHVQLAMPPGGEQEARSFYGRLLGIPERAKPQVLAGRGGCWFECGTLKVHLGVEESFRPAKKGHAAFLVKSLAELLELLDEAGVKRQEPERLDDHIRVFIFDPFGNRLEILERIERL